MAPKAPNKIDNFEYLAAKMAAIKKVLSPNSLSIVNHAELRNADQNIIEIRFHSNENLVLSQVSTRLPR